MIHPKKTGYFFSLLLISSTLIAQQPQFEWGIWKHPSLHGLIQLEGLMRAQESYYQTGRFEKPSTQLLTGRLKLDSRSYLWHPSFIFLNLNLEWGPGLQNQQFVVMPNRSETRTVEQIRLQATLFRQRPVSFNLLTLFSHNFINRDFATSVESVRRDLGVGVSIQNKIAPLTINYGNERWDQKELSTGREFYNYRDIIRAEAVKSFGALDENRLNYAYEDLYRQYARGSIVHHMITTARLQNRVAFNERKNSHWHSNIWLHDQQGTFNQSRLQINQNFLVSLPQNFKTRATYQYALYEQNSDKVFRHNLLGRLEHQLFGSLNSYGYYRYNDHRQNAFQEYINQAAIGFRYRKEILTGQLNLNYEYRLRKDQRDSSPGLLNIVDEEHTLTDGTIILLENPYVELQSIVVTNPAKTVIFEEDLDYILVERDDFVEIARLPGGQIANGDVVLVSYASRFNASYKFDTNAQTFGISFSILDRLIEAHFRLFDQSYDNLFMPENKIMKTISQYVYGVSLNKYFVRIGFEIDHYGSNILPYLSNRYFLNLRPHIGRNLIMNLSANYREYEITSTGEQQKFADVSAHLNYRLSVNSGLKFSAGYRSQEGLSFDLNLLTSRVEWNYNYHQLHFNIGVESFQRRYTGEKINYTGLFARVGRTF